MPFITVSRIKASISTQVIIGIVIAVVVVLIILACLLFSFRKKLKGKASRVNKPAAITSYYPSLFFILNLWFMLSGPVAKKNPTLTQTLSKSGEHVAGFLEEGIIGESKDSSGAEVPLFQFNAVAVATDNFSEENKLGQGGFGPVYMVLKLSSHSLFSCYLVKSDC